MSTSSRIAQEIVYSDKSIFFLYGDDTKTSLLVLDELREASKVAEINKCMITPQERRNDEETAFYIDHMNIRRMIAKYIFVTCPSSSDVSKLSPARLNGFVSGEFFQYACLLLDIDNSHTLFNMKRKVVILTESDPSKSKLFDGNDALLKRCAFISNE